MDLALNNLQSSIGYKTQPTFIRLKAQKLKIFVFISLGDASRLLILFQT